MGNAIATKFVTGGTTIMIRRRWILILLAALLSASLGERISLAKAQLDASAGMNWQPSLDEAKRVAALSNKLILVHFWAPSCKDCKRLEKDVFAQPQVQQAVNARFVAFKLNADDYPTTTKQYGVDRLPTDLIITPAGQIVGRMKCPLSPDVYIQQLNIAASGVGPAANVAAMPGMPATTAAIASAPNSYPPLVPGYGPAPSAYTAAPMNAAVTQPTQYAAQPTQYTAPAIPPVAAPATSPIAQAAPPAKTPAMSAYSDNRYTEYFQRFPNAAAAPAATAAPAVNPLAASAPPVAAPQNYLTAPQGSPAAPSQYSSSLTGMPQYTPPPASPATPGATMAQMAPAAVNWPPSAQSPSTTAATQPYTGASLVGLPTGTITGLSPSVPAATPAVAASASAFGLDGYCPVTLAEQKRWQVGDKRFGVTHRGRTYLFAGPVEQQKFLSNPDRYSPAISGEDVVLALDQGQTVPGQRQFGVEYQNRFYLFASDASRRAFSANPKRYAAEVLQAENPNRPLMR